MIPVYESRGSGRRALRNKVIWMVLVLFCLGGGAAGGERKQDKAIVFSKPIRAVLFEHKAHLGRGLNCDSCHSGLFEMKAGSAESHEDFVMTSLYEGNYCGACHNGQAAFAAKTRCTACHIGVRGYKQLESMRLGLSGPAR
ncbi:MAG: hypothetical protein A2521_01835 [Deltaproteobacteria bacterium RIFOXYD12_FULL_57_12]|nr:MAG: hypothetical protein A2521_01835 [Deltaproteobacteria bacterium RIFOXYD12_FULL_57_12]